MGQDDVINLVMYLSQSDSHKKCEDHYDYLVRRKKLNGVKRYGRVMVSQPTSTNMSAITDLQQWRWYSTPEDTWDEKSV